MYGGDGADKLTREEARAVEPVAPRTKTSQCGQLSEALGGTAEAKMHRFFHRFLQDAQSGINSDQFPSDFKLNLYLQLEIEKKKKNSSENIYVNRKRALQPVKCRKWFVLNTFVFFLNISKVHKDRRGGGPRQERATQNGLVSFSLVNSEVDRVYI